MTPELVTVIIAGIVAVGNFVMFFVQFRERTLERKRALKHDETVERSHHKIRRIASVREAADRLFRLAVTPHDDWSSDRNADLLEQMVRFAIAANTLEDNDLSNLITKMTECINSYRDSPEDNVLMNDLLEAYTAIGVYCERLVEQITNELSLQKDLGTETRMMSN